MKTSMRTECSCSLQGVQLCIFCVNSYLLQEETLLRMGDGCTDLCVQQCIIRNHYITKFLQQNKSTRFSPRPMIYLFSGSWPFSQCQVWIPCRGVAINPNTKWLLTPIIFVSLLHSISCNQVTLQVIGFVTVILMVIFALWQYARVSSSTLNTIHQG